MEVYFEKYEATGNDFVMIDNRDLSFDAADETKIRQICDRRFGVGADGLILIMDDKNTDFEMKYFNSDGKEGSMCGNGGRCAASFAGRRKISQDKKLIFKAFDGKHEALIKKNSVSLKMKDVHEVGRIGSWYFLDTGSPHIVEFVEKLDELDLVKRGLRIRNHKLFMPGGVNVNFVETRNGKVYIRTYERGVENETFSCGTGSVAAAISVYLKFEHKASLPQKANYEIHARGGILNVDFECPGNNKYRNIWLEGPAEHVFSGSWHY